MPSGRTATWMSCRGAPCVLPSISMFWRERSAIVCCCVAFCDPFLGHSHSDPRIRQRAAAHSGANRPCEDPYGACRGASEEHCHSPRQCSLSEPSVLRELWAAWRTHDGHAMLF
jgi:hypothetical protein